MEIENSKVMNKVNFIAIGIAILAGWLGGYVYYKSQIQVKEQAWEMPAGVNCADDGISIIFSCAMHTQVRKAEKGQCPICGMALTTAVRNLYQNPLKLRMSPAAVALSNIETAPVKATQTLTKELQLQGRIEVDPNRLYQQIAHLPGRIEKLYVNEVGAYVRKGQPIASVYSKELIAVVEAFEYSKHSESVLRSAENNIRSWKLSPEKFRKMDLSKGDYRKPVDIYSDFSGVITKTYVQEGTHAANTHMAHPTVLFDIADLSRVWAVFEIHESQLQWVNKGKELTFSLPALPEQTFSARVEQLSPEVDPSTGFATLRVSVDNADRKLRPGMLASAVIKIEKEMASPRVSVPRTAVLWTGKQSVVYIKDSEYSEPVYECRRVQLGSSTADAYVIEAGLEPGEVIVVNGVLRLDAAAQLERKASMMDQQNATSMADF